MIDIKYLRENPEELRQNILNKNEKKDFVNEILELDNKRREIITKTESLKAERNTVSKNIADLKKNKENADDIIAQMKSVSDEIKSLDDKVRDLETELNSLLLNIPNICDESVPIGKNENDNIIIKSDEIIDSTKKLNHIDIAKKFGLIDFERGAKVSGSGFAFYTGKGAALERALINFFIDENVNKGYYEMMPPFLVNAESMKGTGQLPKMAEDMYHATEDDMYLIPTAEVPLTNYYSGEMLPVQDLPIKFSGYSPCFRREAGSYGKDVRGFLRVHQFNKVEIVKFTKPEESFDELENLVSDVEDLIKKLGLKYRILLLCSGDTSFASAKTYDLEVWSQGEQKWLEVSSCSNFLDFQARRANIRFKRTADSKPEFVHTLNGSGLATPRIMVALLESCFDGTKIVIPEVLKKYLSFSTIV